MADNMQAWSLREYDNPADAKTALKSMEKTACLSCADYPAECVYAFENGSRGIIVQDSRSGVKPLILEYGGRIWVGTNFCIACFDAELNQLQNIAVSAPVYSFLCSEENDRIIAVCEIDIFCFDISGNLLWHQPLDDIVSQYSLQGKRFTYTLFEGGSFSADITAAKM